MKKLEFLNIFIVFNIIAYLISCEKLESVKMKKTKTIQTTNTQNVLLKNDDGFERAVFAGGCFWCVEQSFEQVKGVQSVISGYGGGENNNPKYEEVASGRTKHQEAVLVIYDPKKVSYNVLLKVFWQSVDPTQANGQFYDIGLQYTTVIFYLTDVQKKLAMDSKQKLEKSKIFQKPIATKILSIQKFWEAEEYHQDYYRKNPVRYNAYKISSGRDKFTKKTRNSIEKIFK